MEPSARDTKELVDRARGGDKEARERLFRTYSAKLEAAIERDLGDKLRSKLDPKDVLQETYLEAVRDFPDFEYSGKASLYAWFRQISRNKIRELYRHFFASRKRAAGRERSARPKAPGTTRTGTIESVAGDATSPTRAARRSEGTAELASRLSRLTREHRLVISLVKIEELPIAEAARAMGRSENAVKKLLARALDALRQEFDRDGLPCPID